MNSEQYFKYPQNILAAPGQSSVERNPVPWMHTIPSYMPWCVPQTYSLDSDVMKFTAEPTGFSNSSLPSSRTDVSQDVTQLDNTHRSQCKRKGTDFDDDFPFPNKVCIGEEGMVARMSDLYISNNTTLVSSATEKNTGQSSNEVNQRTSTNDFIHEEQQSSPHSMLVFAPELRKLKKPDAIIPSAILNSLKKPSMELMLWKPPGGVVDEIIKNAIGQEQSENKFKSKSNIATRNITKRIPQTVQAATEQMLVNGIIHSGTSKSTAMEDEDMDMT